MTNAVCFLVGAERSGTTLLRLALSSHSQLAWVREFEYSVDRIRPDGSYPDLPDYLEWLSTHRIFQSSGYRIREGVTYPGLVQDFLDQQRAREAKPRVGATVHRNFDRCLALWPDARFIHLVRDPRDVARSVVGMGWAGNAWRGVEPWLETEELWDQLRTRVPEERRIEVRYETFSRQPEKELRRLCAFLDLPYESNMLEFDRWSSYRRPDPAMTEQWKRKASEQEIAWVESRAAEQMATRGYLLSGRSIEAVGPLQRRMLEVDDYAKRVAFRVRRNGIGLSLADWITRRVGADSMQRTLRLRINAVEAKHLR
jgi:hypothetical protein